MAGFHEIIGHEQLIAHLQSAIVMDKYLMHTLSTVQRTVGK